MRFAALLISGFLLTLAPAFAEARAAFLGTWGTPAQCARAPLLQGGSVRAEPFEIRPGWLRQGGLWCRLTWAPISPRGEGLFTAARALCGEDSARGYHLRMFLEGEDLRLVWDFSVANGPLRRC